MLIKNKYIVTLFIIGNEFDLDLGLKPHILFLLKLKSLVENFMNEVIYYS